MTNSLQDTDLQWRTRASRFVAAAVVAMHAALPLMSDWGPFAVIWDLEESRRLLLPLAGLLAVLVLNDGSPPTLGLKFAPVQGWKYWFRMALWFGLAIVVLAVLTGVVFWLAGWTLPILRVDPQYVGGYAVHFCFTAPLTEEVVYRALLAFALLPSLGRWGTIVAGGVVFAAIHISGNPGPDNQIAGFLLMWAFLKSETILVPLAMHAAGNSIALGSHVANWYLFPEALARLESTM